jgi:hypothetical protein
VYIDAAVNPDDAVLVQTESIYDLRLIPDAMGARDLQHPSPTAARRIAEWIRSQIAGV